MSTPDDIRNVAVIGHKGVGQDVARRGRALRRQGDAEARQSRRPDQRPRRLAEEKEHAATLEASVATSRWNGKKVNLVDTPGEGSFVAETRLALGAVRRGDRRA